MFFMVIVIIYFFKSTSRAGLKEHDTVFLLV